MELNLNARNPGEFFAGVGLMHVLGAAGRWREDCAALDLPNVAQAEVNRPMLRNADRFDAKRAENQKLQAEDLCW